MKSIYHTYKFWCILIGMIMALLFNYKFLESALIPDICYHHFKRPPFIFELFYSLPTWNGGHPVPTALNLCITLGVGIVIGYRFYSYVRSRFCK